MPLPPGDIWRNYATDGVPASGAHNPAKSEIREWASYIQTLAEAQGSGAAAVFTTLANLNADLNYAANTMAWVVADGTSSNNGIYQKSGASGSGSWTKRANLPVMSINGLVQNYLRVWAGVQPKLGLAYAESETERVHWNLLANGVAVLNVGGNGTDSPAIQAIRVSADGQVTFANTPATAGLLDTVPAKRARRNTIRVGAYEAEQQPRVAPNNYDITIGDCYRPLRVTGGSPTPTFRCGNLTTGNGVTIITDGGIVRLDAGLSRTWRGHGVRFIDVPDDMIVKVQRINTTECVASIEAGSGSLSSSSSQAAAPATNTAAMIGQSLGFRCFQGYGLEGFQRAMSSAGRTEEWAFVNAAFPNTALLEGNGTSGDWWINDDGTAGPSALAAYNIIDAAIADGDPSPDIIFWDQGQNDIQGVGTSPPVTTFEWYRDQLIALAGLFQTKYPGIIFAITPMPSREAAAVGQTWQQVVREAQLAAIANGGGSPAWIVHGAETYDLERRWRDDHVTLEGQRLQGERLALVAQEHVLSLTPYHGPRIASATRIDDLTVDIEIDFAGGSFELPVLVEGWPDLAVLPAGDPVGGMSVITIIKAVHQGLVGSVRTYRLTQSSANGTGRLVYPYGYAQGAANGRFIRSELGELACRSFRQA